VVWLKLCSEEIKRREMRGLASGKGKRASFFNWATQRKGGRQGRKKEAQEASNRKPEEWRKMIPKQGSEKKTTTEE